MNSARSVLLLVAVLLVGLTVAPVVSGAFASVGTDDRSDEQHDGSVERGVTTFMQSSAADTANTVESEMFEAKYEAADDETRDRLVDQRTDDLAAQLEDLEREHEQLRASDDELSTPQYQARMVRLTVEIAAFEQSVERTHSLATETGVGTDRLETIEAAIADLGDEQIAAVATELVGFDRFLEDERIVEDAAETDADGETPASDEDADAESAAADGEPVDGEEDGDPIDEQADEVDDANPVDESDAEDVETDGGSDDEDSDAETTPETDDRAPEESFADDATTV